MEISFATSRLQNWCEDSNVACKKLGAKCAKKLRRRLADLAAAERVTDLVAGRPHPLKGSREGEMALDLDGGMRLVFRANKSPLPLKEDGTIDWDLVTAVCITYIGDYHD